MEIAKLSIRENERLYLNGEEIKNIISYQIEHGAGNDAVLTVKIPVDMKNQERKFEYRPGISTSIGIPVDQYDRIMIFQSEDDLKEAVIENPNFVSIFGNSQYYRDLFPNVFLAGVKSQSDNEGHN